jgi:hypothetical protein
MNPSDPVEFGRPRGVPVRTVNVIGGAPCNSQVRNKGAVLRVP